MEYIVVDREAMVAAYIGKDKEVEIKSTIEIEGKVYNVTSIYSSAFSNCAELNSIVVKQNVMTVENDILRNADNVIIYCEMEAKPEGWNSTNRPVYW